MLIILSDKNYKYLGVYVERQDRKVENFFSPVNTWLSLYARPHNTQNNKTVLIIFKELQMEDKGQENNQPSKTVSVIEMQWQYRVEKHENQLKGVVYVGKVIGVTSGEKLHLKPISSIYFSLHTYFYLFS